MERRLVPCTTCGRHADAAETACPFCATPRVPSAAATRAWPAQRLTRAAVFSFGAALATASGCGDSHSPSDDAGEPREDAGTEGHDAGNVAPPYGAPAEDGGGPSPLYGGAPED